MSNQPIQARVPGTSEEEPLLGGRGDASLPEGRPLYWNLILGEMQWTEHLRRWFRLTMNTGTGVIAQAGAWIVSDTNQDSVIESQH